MPDQTVPPANQEQTSLVAGGTVDGQPIEWAHRYADRGWRVVPIIPGEKRPALNAWQNAATIDHDLIEAWWTTSYAGHGVGVATGEESGIFVLDVDVANGKVGNESLQALIDQHGALPRGPMSYTPSGGWHLYFRWPEGVEIRNDAGRKLGRGLDIRGEGGQVVAPPTSRTEGGYRWFEDTFTLPAPHAPEWLVRLLTEAPTLAAAVAVSDSDGPAARYNDRTTWAEILGADGWICAEVMPDGEQRWIRPGKSEREGISATVGHDGRDILTVFTTSIEWLPEGSYSRFGYYSCRHHAGDRSAAASALKSDDYAVVDALLERISALTVPATITAAEQADSLIETAHLLEWASFWNEDLADEDWLAHPVIPRGRAIALYAPAKAGKSTIVLAIAAAAATGRPILGKQASEPVEVLYLDYEMSKADLYQRMVELGYGEDDDMSHLHYALLPTMPGLDTPEGARHLLHLVKATNAEFVVIDTFGRAVLGEEDQADTVRDFYRNTGRELKSLGITYLRTDHTGKDTARGMRGSSAKNDDVDVVWKLERSDTAAGHSVKMTRTHSRISWVPDEILIKRVETDSGFDYILDSKARTFPDGTRQDMEELLAAGLLVRGASQRATIKAVRDAGVAMKDKRIRAAFSMFKSTDPLDAVGVKKRGPNSGPRSEEASDRPRPEGNGPRRATPPLTSENERAAVRAAVAAVEVVQPGRGASPYGGRGAPGPAPENESGNLPDLF